MHVSGAVKVRHTPQHAARLQRVKFFFVITFFRYKQAHRVLQHSYPGSRIVRYLL